MKTPCEQCPWRLSNHGKRNFGSFYTKANLKRLWNQIRGGGKPQSCHLTDPSHADHITAGAKPGNTPHECPGSVILINREFRLMPNADNVVTPESIDHYLKTRRDGLTRQGIVYWLISRYQMGGVPFIGGPKIPEVNDDEPGIARLGREAEANVKHSA